MARALMIIDPQYDFIDGTLPVPGAENAMRKLATYLHERPEEWLLKIITCDFHPWDHCSFKTNGGEWPRHCVAFSHGSAIWSGLLEPVFGSPGNTHVLPKGETACKEEYSIFQAEGASRKLDVIFAEHKIDAIDICGIAGDICVLTTLKDGVARYGKNMFSVLTQFSPSLDGGKALADFCQKETICTR